MDRLLPLKSLPQINFENTQNEDADETARRSYINYSEWNFTDLSDITNITENQQSSSSDNENESDKGSDENEADEVPSIRRKTEKKKIAIAKPKILILIEKAFRLCHCKGNTRGTVQSSIYQKWVGSIFVRYN